jgi:hypothetical protein
MRGYTTALLIQFERHRHWGNLLRLFFWLPLYYAKVVMRAVRGQQTGRHRVLLAEWFGCVSGIYYYVRSTCALGKKWTSDRDGW